MKSTTSTATTTTKTTKKLQKKKCNYLTSISFKDETKQRKTARMPTEKWWLRWWSGERFGLRKKQINRLTTLQMGCWNLCWLFCSFRLHILIQLLHWGTANGECICIRLYTLYIVVKSLMDDRYFINFKVQRKNEYQLKCSWTIIIIIIIIFILLGFTDFISYHRLWCENHNHWPHHWKPRIMGFVPCHIEFTTFTAKDLSFDKRNIKGSED